MQRNKGDLAELEATFNTPPCSETLFERIVTMPGRCIHDGVAQREELLRPQGFREEVGEVVVRVDVRYRDAHVLDALSDEEVATFDVLRPLMMLRVIR